MVTNQTAVIDGMTFGITQLTTMKSLRMLNRLGRALGPALAKLGSVSAGNVADMSVGPFGEAVAALCERLSDDELEAITRELLATATVNGALLMPQFDVTLQGRADTVIKLLKFALTVNYGSFFNALNGLGGMRAGSQSEGSTTSPTVGPVGA